MIEEMNKALVYFGREDLTDGLYENDIDDNVQVFLTIRQMIKLYNLQSKINKSDELIETYKNERDTYKRLAEEYINKYNKEKEKNKRAINRISIVRMDNDTPIDTHRVLDYILKSLIGG